MYLFVFQSYAYKYISFISLSNVWLNVEYTHGNKSLNIAVNKYHNDNFDRQRSGEVAHILSSMAMETCFCQSQPKED